MASQNGEARTLFALGRGLLLAWAFDHTNRRFCTPDAALNVPLASVAIGLALGEQYALLRELSLLCPIVAFAALGMCLLAQGSTRSGFRGSR